ncbi:hypothetical protein FDP41_002449 [Naegleria fowleri]|uniref:Conserved oligomeric Golgi complex subunit 3 n=1 Tax=Naegleria fowleri TaxID=5763 RepID=A0A6A5C0D9_NAEFO|nr:uncharacterized protein FDP41_002449 [Naegleria fowleri]KAF0978629.1 hypothetical protein FDP41_002449 [Naegleria fowleri]
MSSSQAQSTTTILCIIDEWEKSTVLLESEEKLLEIIRKSKEEDTSYGAEQIDISDDAERDDDQNEGTGLIMWDGDFLEHDDDDQQIDYPYENYLSKLKHYQELSHSLIVKSNNTLAISDDLQEQYNLVCSKTSRLHHDCETLVKETEQLEKCSMELGNRLKHFDDTDYLNQQLSSSGYLDVGSDAFIKTLGKLEESINFLSNNLDYKEAKTYLTKHKYLLSKSLAHVRDHIILKIKSSVENLFTKLKSVSASDELQEFSLLFIDFKVSIEKDKQAKIDFARSACEYMIQICAQETHLFHHFFTNCKDERRLSHRFSNFMGTFTNILYDTVREMAIKENRIDTLCSLIEVLRNDILQEGIKTKKTVPYFEAVVHLMVQDIQERLIYRTSFFIANEVTKYQPTPEDLDYPNKLKLSPEEGVSPEKPSRKQFGIYYTTLGWTLSLLSKLYKVLDVEVFEGLAQEAVSACALSFIDASKKISEKTDVMNGSLFLISHLLTLLHELSYFNVSFTKTETSLDFSHLFEGISRFLKGQASFSVTSLIFDLLSQTRPRLVVSSFDSKKDLEKQLKLACENFILNTVKQVADSCMTFIKKHNINKDTQESNEVIIKEIQNIRQEMNVDLKTKLSYSSQLMTLYLREEKTSNKLSEPITEQLNSLYQQLLNYLNENTTLEQSQKTELIQSLLSPEQFSSLLLDCFRGNEDSTTSNGEHQVTK